MHERQLQHLGSIPFGREVLLPLLAGYKRPNDKIAEWLAQDVLVPLKRGLYVVGSAWRTSDLVLPLVANRLYGPSCVSLDYALSHYGLIPERVHEITSVCTGRGRIVKTQLGTFSYTRLPFPLYPVGIRQERESDMTTFLIATPEKALCDKVLLTPNLQATSRPSMRAFLFDDLRIDPDNVINFNLDIVQQYVAYGEKPRQMKALLTVLKETQA